MSVNTDCAERSAEGESKMKLSHYKLGAIAAAACLAAPLTAHAADRRFCRDYTEEAIDQARAVRENPYCAGAVEYDPARWSFDRRGHFEWCLYMPPEAAERERYERSRYLSECGRRRRPY